MQLVTRVAALLALTATSLAQLEPDPDFDAITKPGLNEKVPAGKTYTVEWTQPETAPDGPVTLSLIGGVDQGHQNVLEEIGTAENSDLKFDWKISSDLGDLAIYGLKIALDADPAKFQYSTPFHIVGGSSSGNDTSSSTKSDTHIGTATASDTTSTKSHESTGTGTAATVTSNVTTTETTASSTGTESPSGTNSAPATKTSDSSATRAVAGLIGGLAAAVFAL